MEKVKHLRENNEEIDKVFSIYEFKKIRQGNLHPINMGHFLEKRNESLRGELLRENIFKNVAFSIIIKNRISRQSQLNKF